MTFDEMLRQAPVGGELVTVFEVVDDSTLEVAVLRIDPVEAHLTEEFA